MEGYSICTEPSHLDKKYHNEHLKFYQDLCNQNSTYFFSSHVKPKVKGQVPVSLCAGSEVRRHLYLRGRGYEGRQWGSLRSSHLTLDHSWLQTAVGGILYHRNSTYQKDTHFLHSSILARSPQKQYFGLANICQLVCIYLSSETVRINTFSGTQLFNAHLRY